MIINMNGAKAPETPSSVLQEKTVTPETLPVVIGPDEGYDGLTQVTVNPDSQLIPTNIRSGKTIFGIAGTFSGNGNKTDSEALVQTFLSCRESVPSISTTDFKNYFGRDVDANDIWHGAADEFILDTNDVVNGFVASVINSLGDWAHIFGVQPRWPCHLVVKNMNLYAGYDPIVNGGYIQDIEFINCGPSITCLLGSVFVLGGVIEIPEGITDIGPNTFDDVRGYDMTRYTYSPMTVIVPSTVTRIGSRGLNVYGHIVMKATVPPKWEDTWNSVIISSSSTDPPTITVPKGTLDAYKTASGWSKVADYIVEATE